VLETRLAPEPLDAGAEYASFARPPDAAGAIVSFTGLTRPTSRDGGDVRSLFLDHHPRLTAQSLEEIGQAALHRFDLAAVRIVHRCGTVAPGEPIVFVAAASAHRRAAFEAVDYMMDRLKTDAVFWKREDRADGSEWVEPSDADRSAHARWSGP
jgi:molybdopterin synthase catalytic subunit